MKIIALFVSVTSFFHLIFMRVLAVNDVRRYEMVHDPGQELYANDTTDETNYKDPRRLLWGIPAFGQRFLC